MAAPGLPTISAEEYLRLERASPERHEFVNGVVYAMSGASFAHNSISVNLASLLEGTLRGQSCSVLASDMRVRVDAIGTYMYPDVVVMCGKPEFEDAVVDTLLNPVLVIEVLSPSTERYDRGARFAHYRAIPSLQAYMLVAQDRAWVELYVRQPYDTWNLRACIGRPNQVDIEPLGIRIELSDIYESLDVPDTLPDLIDPSREP